MHHHNLTTCNQPLRLGRHPDDLYLDRDAVSLGRLRRLLAYLPGNGDIQLPRAEDPDYDEGTHTEYLMDDSLCLLDI